MDLFTVYIIGAVLTGLWSVAIAWEASEDLVENISQGCAAILIGALWFIFVPCEIFLKILRYRGGI